MGLLDDLAAVTDPAEMQALMQAASDRMQALQAQQRSAEQQVREAAVGDVDALRQVAGPPIADAAPSTEHLAGLLKTDLPGINAAPAVYLKATWVVLLVIVRALIRALGLAAGRPDAATETT